LYVITGVPSWLKPVVSPDLVPTEVGHRVLRDVGDALAGHQRDREAGVHQGLSKLVLGRVIVVEVKRVGVLRQQGEPDVVGARDGASKAMAVDVPHLEILEEATLPALLTVIGIVSSATSEN